MASLMIGSVKEEVRYLRMLCLMLSHPTALATSKLDNAPSLQKIQYKAHLHVVGN